MRCYTTDNVAGARKAEIKFEAAKLPNRETAPMFEVLQIFIASEHESSTAETSASRRVPTC
jgi:hypothetical protein